MIETVAKKDKVKNKIHSKWNIFTKATAPSTAVTRPMSNINPQMQTGKSGYKKGKNDKNEIFVDIFEKLSVSLLTLFTIYYISRSYSIKMARSSTVK